MKKLTLKMDLGKTFVNRHPKTAPLLQIDSATPTGTTSKIFPCWGPKYFFVGATISIKIRQ